MKERDIMLDQVQKTKVNIEVPTDLLTNFRKAAKDRELTVSALIRLLMKEYLKGVENNELGNL